MPALREKVTVPGDVAVLDAMGAEHAHVDPQLDAVDEAFAASDAVSLTQSVQALTEGLTGHMRHEENEALPLVETLLGPGRWAAFGRAIRKTQGLRAGAEYLPWVLDGAPATAQAQVLGLLRHRSGSSTAGSGRRSTGASPGGTAPPASERKPPARWRL